MAISSKKYVDITSGVGGAALVGARSLVARIFTVNNLIPPNTFISFDSAAEAGEYFGASSEEYKRAAFYFNWVSKSITSPSSIQFARWVDQNTTPLIFGSKASTPNLSVFQSITAGEFKITIGDTTETIAGLNFTSPLVNNLAEVAQLVEKAIQDTHIIYQTCSITNSSPTVTVVDSSVLAEDMVVTGAGIPASTTILAIVDATTITLSQNATATDASADLGFYDPADLMWVDATVTYDATQGIFKFTGGVDTADAAISISNAEGAGTEIAGVDLLGWLPEAVNTNGILNPADGAIFAAGSLAQDVVTVVSASAESSNDFGTFLFTTSAALTLDEVKSLAQWNASQNGLFMYTVAIDSTQLLTWPANFVAIDGVALTLSVTPDEYPELAPSMIAAATDYNRVNAVQNYMFQMFNLTPSVTTTSASNALDAVAVNYYGSTQTAGQSLSFYQRGLLQGYNLPTAITDMGAYMNEVWFKDAAQVALLNLLLSMGQIGANAQGKGQVLAVLQGVIGRALNNGTISVGKTLSDTQKVYITTITNDDDAWHQVQSLGYWLDCVIEPVPNITPEQYQARYTLVYSKNDVIRKVVGSQILI